MSRIDKAINEANSSYETRVKYINEMEIRERDLIRACSEGKIPRPDSEKFFFAKCPWCGAPLKPRLWCYRTVAVICLPILILYLISTFFAGHADGLYKKCTKCEYEYIETEMNG